MAITYLGKKTGDAQRGGFSITGASQILLYLVDDGEDVTKVLGQPEIPAYHSAHPFAPNLVCTDVSVSKVDGSETKHTHEVTASYSEQDKATVEPSDSETKPWELPVTNFSILPVDNVVPFEKAYQNGDVNGAPTKPVLSSAKTPINISTNKANLMIHFAYNLQDVRDIWVVEYHNTVNQDNILVTNIYIPKKLGLLRTWKPTLKKDYDSDGEPKWTYYVIDVEIEINLEGWTRSVADMSLWAMDSGQPYRVCRCDYTSAGTNGFGKQFTLYDDIKAAQSSENWNADKLNDMLNTIQPIDEPITLDGSGGLSFDGVNFKPVYIDYEDKFAACWHPLSLPDSRY